MQYTMKNLAME